MEINLSSIFKGQLAHLNDDEHNLDVFDLEVNIIEIVGQEKAFTTTGSFGDCC